MSSSNWPDSRNIGRFGVMECRLSAEVIDTQRLDELAWLILGKPSRIDRLWRVSDGMAGDVAWVQ
jgi:hypothetical protein